MAIRNDWFRINVELLIDFALGSYTWMSTSQEFLNNQLLMYYNIPPKSAILFIRSVMEHG
jgi:hypothetical protein